MKLNQVKQFLLNPVMNKEYRLRMRTMRSMWIIFAYLLLLLLFVFGVFAIMGMFGRDSFVYGNSDGQVMFYFLSYGQLGLIAFIAPALTAGVISGEREKQTLNLLLTTRQSSFNIIVSKLLSGLGFMMLIVFSALPLYGILFLYGGTEPKALLQVYVFYLFNMLLYGAVGVMFSTLFKRTIVAIILTYGFVIFIYVATFILFLIVLGLTQINNPGPVSDTFNLIIARLIVINPAAMLYTATAPNFIEEIANVSSTNLGWYYQNVPIVIEFYIFYSLVIAGSLMIAIRKLRPTK